MHNGSEKTEHDDSLYPDKDVDEYELYYGENAPIEQAEEKPVLPGPLSRRPSFTSSFPLFAISILFVTFSFILNNSLYSDYLWASGETVFSKHEYWRLFTAVFTHSDVLHLLSNLPLFFFFGLFLYDYFGFFVFPVISLIIGVSANIATLYLYPETVRLVGASGMVYGMTSLGLILYIYHDNGRTMLMRIFRSIGFTLIILFPTTYDPATSYLAHASGFFIGIFCAVMILPFVKVKIRED